MKRFTNFVNYLNSVFYTTFQWAKKWARVGKFIFSLQSQMSKVQQWKDKGQLDLRRVNWTLLNRTWNNEVPATETACSDSKAWTKEIVFFLPFLLYLLLFFAFSLPTCLTQMYPLNPCFSLNSSLRAYTRQSFTFHLLSFCSYCGPINSVWYFNLPRQREILSLCLFPLRLYVNFLNKRIQLNKTSSNKSYKCEKVNHGLPNFT